MQVTIIDYGVGNLWSVCNAIKYLGYQPHITSDPIVVRHSSILILPGVGSFYKAMTTLKNKKLVEPIQDAIQSKESKILGICLGMHLMAETGTEDGLAEGIGLIPAQVDRFSDLPLGVKVPHMGFNAVKSDLTSRLFSGLPRAADFYFAHSYRIKALNNKIGDASLCEYGDGFVAAYEYENIFATQFHPEKSQHNGLKILKNFFES
jgi:glutamine amidotransferase